MRSQHRADQGVIKKRSQRGSGNATRDGVIDRVGDRAFARLRTFTCVGAVAPYAMLVLGDVGEMREIAESANDLTGRGGGEPVQNGLKLAPGDFIGVAMKPHGGAANVLDQLEDGLAFLLAHHISQHAAQEPNVVAQRNVLVGVAAQMTGVDQPVGRCQVFDRHAVDFPDVETRESIV